MTINKILTDIDREILKPDLEEMIRLAPEMSARKFYDALIQQTFVFNYIKNSLKPGSHILSAGSWEDTAGEALKMLGYAVVDVDPAINTTLHNFYLRSLNQFDAIISTSVLEHVENDEEFLANCCNMLKCGGIGVFTMDFRDNRYSGTILPPTDVRLYTEYDLTVRLPNILHSLNCSLVDIPDYTSVDRWTYAGIPYSFATFVFERNYE